MANGEQTDFNYWLAGGQTAVGAVPGLFEMNGFYSSVEQQILTKMGNQTIQNVAATTSQNILLNELYTGLPSIGVDVGQAAFSSPSAESQPGSAYLQGPLGGKH
jgi:hypothetical protein